MLTDLIAVPGRIDVIGVGDTEDNVVAAIRRLKPDVVILDLQLKTGSGAGVIRTVRASAELSGTRLLVTSNHASPQMRAGCLDLGADGYYDKVKELVPLTTRLQELADAKLATP
jgi:DNA-binding NarL/FixJ family response regulator